MPIERKQNLKKFVEYWTFQRGSEKGEDQQFWNSLLGEVLGVSDVKAHIKYQLPVQLKDTTKFLDAWIPETRVLIEHKSRGVNLDAPQFGHDGKTPYEQALEYDNARSFDEKARWIVLCNFDEFRIYDRTKPLDAPLKMRLADLPKEAHRLAFLVDAKEKAIDRELEISVQAGKIVGEIYDALLGQYDFKQTDLLTPNGVREGGSRFIATETADSVSGVSREQIRVLNNAAALAALNRLCVRLVFCLYAEDADIFPKDCFRRLLEATPAQFLRKRLLDLFAVLDTPPERRDPYLEPELAAFPYTNGGLFRTGRTGFQPVHGGLGANRPTKTGRDARSPSEDAIPPLTEHIRQLLINASLFDWRDISPTIFGALFESTLNPQTRRAGGMHYTSIENIHKVIDPLFLREFTARVDAILATKNAKNAEGGSLSATQMQPLCMSSATVGTGHGDAASIRVAGAGNKQTDLLTPNGVREGGSRFIATEAADRVSGVSREQIRLLTKKDRAALLALQSELASLTIFDPACGSGNFLTETYLSLRRLENRIIAALQGAQGELDLGAGGSRLSRPQDGGRDKRVPPVADAAAAWGQAALPDGRDKRVPPAVRVSIRQFHGIEINDFAVSVAKTALWIAEAQMLRETAEILHREPDFLPLKDYDGIVEGNALRIDWKAILEVRSTKDEVRSADFGNLFIIGNPPFVGARNKSPAQAADMEVVFGKDWKGLGNLDYVTAWYKKAAEIGIGRCAFVSTNSICQGDGVTTLWKPLFEKYGVEIDFAHRTFRWDSEASDKAHVHCVIVGFHAGEGNKQTDLLASNDAREMGGARLSRPPGAGGRSSPTAAAREDTRPPVSGVSREQIRLLKLIFPSPDGAGAGGGLGASRPTIASHINAYLMDAPDAWVESRREPLSTPLPLLFGSMPNDGGHLSDWSPERRAALVARRPTAAPLFRRITGSAEYINNVERWCLWLKGASPAAIRAVPEVMDAVAAVREMRLASRREATRRLAATPTLFGEIRQPYDGHYIVIPSVSSERREYIPIGFLPADVIASNLVLIVPGADLYHFGVLTSSVHMAWMRAVAGRLKSDYRYSAAIVYNNFVWPFEVEEQTDLLASNDAREGESRLSRPPGAGNGDARPPVSRVSGEQIRVLKTKITATAQAILDARARYPDSSLADLYDPLTMPPDLRAAHEANDRAVLEAYGLVCGRDGEGRACRDRNGVPPESEIVAHLFRLYAAMTGKAVVPTAEAAR